MSYETFEISQETLDQKKEKSKLKRKQKEVKLNSQQRFLKFFNKAI